MKTKLFFFSLLMAVCTQGLAQDIIHTFDSAPIEAKVLEIGESSILYKAYNNPDGPNYRMSVDRIVRIVFENGTERVFARPNLFATSPYRYDYSGPIHYRWGHYYGRYGRIDEDRLQDYLGVSLYGSQYITAKRQYTWGYSLTLAGSTLLIFTIFEAAAHADFMSRAPSGFSSGDAISVVCGLAGAAALGAGIPLWVSGNKKLNALADDYNKKYGNSGHSYAPSLNLGATSNGVGLAFRF